MSVSDLDRSLHATVLKREAVKEREYRDERARKEEEFYNSIGTTDMTKQELRKIVDGDRRQYYRSEELNDKLYIHYKGWKQIQHLDKWTGLKALYAECNAFDRIQGLQNCRMLRSLFLQENCIKTIEGLENCVELWNLNLSNNFIERIEGLSKCRKLNTLTIAKNKIGIGGMDDVIGLLDTTISSLDIQDNKIWDGDILPEVFMRMEDLRVLYLKGNPCSKKIPNYRKSLTSYCSELRYLDDRPVFPEDRRAAEAFNRGGLEAERAERRLIKEEERDRHDRNMKAFSDMIARAKSEKREREAMRMEDKYTDETDPVVSNEKRMQQMVDKWREDNAADLKDDAKEAAIKKLSSEALKTQGVEEPNVKAEESHESDKKATDGEKVKETTVTADQVEGEKKKVDNRKLVYEDIWDDIPPVKAPENAGERVRSDHSQKVAGRVAAEDAAASSEVFLPWATGNVAGMEAMPPSSQTLEKRVTALQAKAASVGASDKPGWYSKYAEKAQEQQEVPASGCSQPAAGLGSELDEMD